MPRSAPVFILLFCIGVGVVFVPYEPFALELFLLLWQYVRKFSIDSEDEKIPKYPQNAVVCINH